MRIRHQVCMATAMMDIHRHTHINNSTRA